MNYPPPHHQESNFQNAIHLVKQAPLATLISSHDDQIHCTHSPLIYHTNNNLGFLIGHIDRANPQCSHFDTPKKVTAIFHGPDVYISPSVYETTQLPTWNYFKVHLEGKLTLVEDREKVKKSLVDMTQFLEGKEPKYKLDPTNPRMERALDFIVGFRIDITGWEGKFKISQDKRLQDQNLAKKALLIESEKRKKLIETLYAHHQTKPF